jgi:xylan 1,4-beta-xylosidase
VPFFTLQFALFTVLERNRALKASVTLAILVLAAVAAGPAGCKKAAPPASSKATKPAPAKTVEKSVQTRPEEFMEAEERPFGAPEGLLVEAESPKPAGDCEVVTDPDASGRAAVTSAKDWQALFAAPPPKEGAAFTVWIRHRAGPICLKSVEADGQLKELHWIQARPEKWAWSQAGRYSRAELAQQVLIVRGAKSPDPDPMVDCVVFASDPETLATGNLAEVKKELPPAEPGSGLPPVAVTVTVTWEGTAGRMPADLWGVNEGQIADPKAAADAKYQALLKGLRPPLVRIHRPDLADAWTDEKTKKWDVEKIKAGFAASTGYGGAKLLVNIPGWPKWMADPAHPELLAPGEEGAFATLCVDLVRVMRDDVKRPVEYWEVMNEKEAGYDAAGRLGDYWTLLNTVFDAMRKADPDARIGGPAFAWAKTEWVDAFIKQCGRRIDFLSWHNYASGDLYEPNKSMLGKPARIALAAHDIARSLKLHLADRTVEIFLTEYNIKWSREPVERRQAGNLGAVFDACLLKRLVSEQVDGAMIYQAKGDAYGLFDAQNHERPAGRLYKWGAAYLTGRIASHTVGDEALLQVLPIVRPDGVRSLLLVNKSNRTVTVPSQAKLMPLQRHEKAALLRVDAAWPKVPPKAVPAGDLPLPGYSVTLLTTATEEAGTAK